jgi:hypothetical protein
MRVQETARELLALTVFIVSDWPTLITAKPPKRFEAEQKATPEW